MVSRIGSIVSFVALLFFIFLLWEAFVSQRRIVSSSHISSSLEWQDVVPLDFHNYSETGVITSPN